MKIINSDDGGTLVSRNRQASLYIFVHIRAQPTCTNSSRHNQAHMLHACMEMHMYARALKHQHTLSSLLFPSSSFSETCQHMQAHVHTHTHYTVPSHVSNHRQHALDESLTQGGRCRAWKIPKANVQQTSDQCR